MRRNRGPPEALCVSGRPNTELLKNNPEYIKVVFIFKIF